jgi:mutator protein MutT
MKTCTLALFVADGRLLLAMKKRGFGQGRWNGPGGKIEAGESVEQAMVRECQEEIGLTPLEYQKMAIHDFVFPEGQPDMRVHVFVCAKWQGEPAESEEMAPRWFAIGDIPYDDMWQDDPYWLPRVLAGQQLHTRFSFDAEENMLTHQVHEAAL